MFGKRYLGSGDHGEGDAGVARGGLDQHSLAGRDVTTLLGLLS